MEHLYSMESSYINVYLFRGQRYTINSWTRFKFSACPLDYVVNDCSFSVHCLAGDMQSMNLYISAIVLVEQFWIPATLQ